VLFRDEIPKGPTGKLQRIGLAQRLGVVAAAQPARQADRAYLAPRTPVEELLARLWGEILRLDRIGIDENFLDLGGDSMLATRLVSRIRQELRLELSLRSVFDAPTVAQQAELLLEQLLRESEGAPMARELHVHE
jgi:oxalate---CoA ligase